MNYESLILSEIKMSNKALASLAIELSIMKDSFKKIIELTDHEFVNKTKAAKILGVSLETFKSYMGRFDFSFEGEKNKICFKKLLLFRQEMQRKKLLNYSYSVFYERLQKINT